MGSKAQNVARPSSQPTAPVAPVSMPEPTAVAPVAQPVAAVAPAHALAIRFAEPSYRGKPAADGTIKRPNVADAVIVGAFGAVKLQLAGFTLANASGSIVVYSSTYGGFERKPSIGPLRVPPPPGIEPGTDDGLVNATGAKADMERFEQSIRDAWASANVAGPTKWGIDIPLSL